MIAACLVIPPALRSRYTLYFPQEHSVPAIMELLTLSSRVEAVRWLPVGRAHTDCPISAPGAIFAQQWELKSSRETGHEYNGVRANYAWCNGYKGADARIYQIEVRETLDDGVSRGGALVFGGSPFLASEDKLHPDAASCSDPLAPLNECSNHATQMAIIMAGCFPGESGNGIVGIAPDAQLYPLPAYDGFDDFLDDLQELYGLAYSSMSFLAMPFGFPFIDNDLRMEGDYWLGQLKDPGMVASFAPALQIYDPYPGFDYVYPGSSPQVMGVGSVPRWNDPPLQPCVGGSEISDPNARVKAPCGYFDAMANMYMAGGWDAGRDSNGSWRHGLSISTAIATASAALINHCKSPTTVDALFDLMDTASDDGSLDIAFACDQPVGIEDVSGFGAAGGYYENTLTWVVDDAEGISTFRILESPICWGPFRLLTSFPPGEHTDDDMNYEISLPAQVYRNYVYKLVVEGDGGSRDLIAACYPSEADMIPIGAAPTGLEFRRTGVTTAEISWSAASNEQMCQYWVYGGPMEDLTDCGPNTQAFGGWLNTVLDPYEADCNALVPEDRCWNVSGLVPGVPYSFRVALAKRQSLPDGPVMWGVLSSELTDYAVPPAEVAERGSDMKDRIQILPVPAAGDREITIIIPRGERNRYQFGIYDPGGRRIDDLWRVVETEGHGPRVVKLVPTRPAEAGVYFVRVESEGRALVKRLVVLD